jgi:hypothetical protein
VGTDWPQVVTRENGANAPNGTTTERYGSVSTLLRKELSSMKEGAQATTEFFDGVCVRVH